MVSSLRVEVKSDPAFEVLLDRDSISVGRAEDNTLALRDMNVSRHHFTIEHRADGAYLLHDRGSRNGTVVNGIPVLDRVLQAGDRITVGGSVLTFVPTPTAAAIPVEKAPRPRPSPGAAGKASGLSGDSMTLRHDPHGTAAGSRPAPPPPAPAAPAKPPAPADDFGLAGVQEQPRSAATPSHGLPRPVPAAEGPRAPPPRAPGVQHFFADIVRSAPSKPALAVDPGEQASPSDLTSGGSKVKITRFAGRKDLYHADIDQAKAEEQKPKKKPTPTAAEGPTSYSEILNEIADMFAPDALKQRRPSPAEPEEEPAVRAEAPAAAPPPPVPAAPVARAAPPPAPMMVGERSLTAALSRARWRKLAEAAAALNKERVLSRLLDTIVDSVLALVPAKGAYVILREEGGLRVAVARGHGMPIEADQSWALRFSKTVCHDAITSGRPVLTMDAGEDRELANAVSIADMHLKAILCVPFASEGEVLGVVYLDEPACELEGTGAEDVVELVGAFGDLAGIALANARYVESALQHERLQEELRIAARFQRKLLPAEAPRVPGLEIAGCTLPAVEMSGDIYDFFLANGALYASIGDVSGKGVGAAIVMATVRALLRSSAEREPRTDKLLELMNRSLARDLEAGTFVSFLLLRWDATAGELRYAGAGHEHIIVVRASGDVQSIRTGGTVLGLAPDLRGRVEEKALPLAPGETVVLYTDGATEAFSPAGKELGLDGLTDLVGRAGKLSAREIVDYVMAEVKSFQGGADPTDDLTVVAIRRA